MKSGNNKQQRKQFEGGGKSRDGNNMKAKEETVSEEESGQLAQMPPRGPVRESMWLLWVLTRWQSLMTLTQLSQKQKLD